jgi:hypothetical protein
MLVDEVKCFDPSWDSDIAALLDRCGVTQFRSAALLNWKFVERPIGHHQIFVLRNSNGGLRGMLVVKWMAQTGVASWVEIVDYLVAPEDIAGFQELVRRATITTVAHGFDFVRFRLSRPEHLAVLVPPFWIDHQRLEDDSVFAFSHDKSLLDALGSSPWHATALVAHRAEPGRDEWPSNDMSTSRPRAV